VSRAVHSPSVDPDEGSGQRCREPRRRSSAPLRRVLLAPEDPPQHRSVVVVTFASIPPGNIIEAAMASAPRLAAWPVENFTYSSPISSLNTLGKPVASSTATAIM